MSSLSAAPGRRPADRRVRRINWDDLQFFLALAEGGTLSSAARSLSVTHVTMARRIAQLEETLGSSLFDQTPKGFILTDKGQRILDYARLMCDQVTTIQDMTEIAGSEGPVRLSATPFLCTILTTHVIPDLYHAHPGIVIDLLAENRNVNLARQEAHLSLRLARPQSGEFIIRKLATLSYGLYRARGTSLEILSSPIVGFTEEFDTLPEATWLASLNAHNAIAFRSNSLSCQINAVEAGIGIGILPIVAAHDNDRLERLDGSSDSWSREIWLVRRRTLDDVLRVRIVAEHLIATFTSMKPLLER